MRAFTNFLISMGFYKRKLNLLIVGLDNSGKTTIINNCLGSASAINSNEIVPTVGFQVVSFTQDVFKFSVFDMSGQGKYRDLWQHYFAETDAVIFVIDSSDRLRCCVARDELEVMLKDKGLVEKRVPILFYANKNDLEDTMTPAECSNILGLESIKNHNWYIQGCNGLTGDGISTGMILRDITCNRNELVGPDSLKND
jgi:ADP-ribosylation factor-like protein 6